MNPKREVSELDLRMPEFRDAKVEDLEFRDDGKVVRKDRWEVAVRNIASILGWSRKAWETHDIVEEVRRRLVDEPTKRSAPDIDALVNRFLGWKAPDTFLPDGFVTFHREEAIKNGSWPIGTNLLTAVEAKQMFTYCLKEEPDE